MHEMTVAEAHAAFLEHRKRRRRAASTLDLYGRQLAVWRSWRNLGGYGSLIRDVTLRELQLFFVYVEDEMQSQPRTVRSFFRTLRGLWNWLAFEEDRAGEPVLKAKQLNYFKNDRIPLPEPDERERPALSKTDYEKLLLAADSDDAEECYRNEAILRLLWESGMRVHELAKLDHENVNLQARSAVIVGKGNKQGIVFWGPQSQLALLNYLMVRRGPRAGPLLRGISSRNNGQALTPNLIRLLIKRLAKRAGVALPPGSPCHSFRRAFARNGRKADLSYENVGELLRDNTASVVRTYVGLDMASLRKLHEKALRAM